IGESDPAIRALLARDAREHGAISVRVVIEESRISDVAVDAAGTSFTLEALDDTRRLRTPLSGIHQSENTAFALRLLVAAGAPYKASLAEAESLLSDVHVPARFQRSGRFIFDVAHNPEGAAVLAQTLAAVRPTQPVVAVFCVLNDKDWRRMLRLL